jgi:hypothetical protein
MTPMCLSENLMPAKIPRVGRSVGAKKTTGHQEIRKPRRQRHHRNRQGLQRSHRITLGNSGNSFIGIAVSSRDPRPSSSCQAPGCHRYTTTT